MRIFHVMKHIYCTFTSAALFLLCMACNETVDKKLIVGDWKGSEWLVQGQPAMIDASTAAFTFRDDGTYTYAYAEALESGKYFISNNELFTTPTGGIKMMVKIVQLTPDTLVFDMNRGGTSEKLTLVRK